MGKPGRVLLGLYKQKLRFGKQKQRLLSTTRAENSIPNGYFTEEIQMDKNK